MSNLCICLTQKGEICKNKGNPNNDGKCYKHKNYVLVTFKFNMLPMEIKLMIINYLDYISFTEFIKIENNFDFCFDLINNDVENKKFIFYKKLDYLEINNTIHNMHFIRPFYDGIMKIANILNKNYFDRLDEIVLSNKNEEETSLCKEFTKKYLKLIRIYYIDINIFINIMYWLKYNFNDRSYVAICAAFHIIIKLFKYGYPYDDTIDIQREIYKCIISTDELAEKINEKIVIILFNLYKDGIIFD